MSKDLKIRSSKLQDLGSSLDKKDGIKILPSTRLLIDLQERVNSKERELNNLCLNVLQIKSHIEETKLLYALDRRVKHIIITTIQSKCKSILLKMFDCLPSTPWN